MSRRRPFRLMAVLLAVFVAACASSTPQLLESMDPRTGVTVTRTTTPMIFYRDNSAIAAHARDFVYLGPVAVNRRGEYRYYLWLGIWSVIDREELSVRHDAFESIVLFADGEPLFLDIHGWTPDGIGLSEGPYPVPVASAAEAYYAVTIDQIRLLASARTVSLRAGMRAGTEYFPWDSQASAREGLRFFTAGR